jgi:cyclopropane fatty-acyl-phospholipid synthase-like methyltransferase
MSKTGETYFAEDLEAMDSASNYYSWMLSAFTPYIGQRVLEVGAGSGNFSKRLLERSPELLTCLEPSENVAQVLEQRLAGDARAEARRGLLKDHAAGWQQRYDTIFYINVMEHVEHDAEEVQLALSCLRPGGHLLIFVPALPWLYGKADEMFGHFRRYTKGSLEALFQGTATTVRRSQYWDIFGVLPWWVSFVLLQRSVMSSGMVKLYDSLVVPVARVLEGAVTPPVGKNVMLIAQKQKA